MGHAIIIEVDCPTCGAKVGERCPKETHAIRVIAFRNTMIKAFHLVNPAAYAQELARRGLISQEAADHQDWRGEIARAVTLEAMQAEGLTLQNVEDSIRYMTGTSAQIVPSRIAGEPWVSYREERPGFLFLAIGYRKGPAGP